MKNYYTSTKTYGHERGLSTAFRQWRALSHCSKLHGYALSFTFTFGATHLDGNGWVVDFGGLDGLQRRLKRWFDHTVVVAEDDPHVALYRSMHEAGVLQLRLVERTGCEAFAKLAYDLANAALDELGERPRVRVLNVEVREHGSNSAIYHSEEVQ